MEPAPGKELGMEPAPGLATQPALEPGMAPGTEPGTEAALSRPCWSFLTRVPPTPSRCPHVPSPGHWSPPGTPELRSRCRSRRELREASLHFMAPPLGCTDPRSHLARLLTGSIRPSRRCLGGKPQIRPRTAPLPSPPSPCVSRVQLRSAPALLFLLGSHLGQVSPAPQAGGPRLRLRGKGIPMEFWSRGIPPAPPGEANSSGIPEEGGSHLLWDL